MLRTLSTVDQGLVEVANSLLTQLHVPVRVESLEDINVNVFITLFEGLYGEPLPELLPNPQTKQDDIHNCQVVIDTLANKILHTSLSHITGEEIVEGERTSVANLLEILTGLLEFLTEKIECENSQDEEEEDVFHDEAFLGSQENIDQLVEGIKNLSQIENTTMRRKSEKSGKKIAWEDFKKAENLKENLKENSPKPVSPVQDNDDFLNLTFSIPSCVGPPSRSPSPTQLQPPPSPPPLAPPSTDENKAVRNSSSSPVDLVESDAKPRSEAQSKEKSVRFLKRQEDQNEMDADPKIAHVTKLPEKKVSGFERKASSQQLPSSKRSVKRKENVLIKLPREEEKKTLVSTQKDEDIYPAEVTELLKTYSNNRTTDELLDMIDVTLKQLESESRPSTSQQRISERKQVHFEEPFCLKKVRTFKAPVSMWRYRQTDWKKNKKLKFLRRNYAEDLAELHQDVCSKIKAEKTVANEKERELLKISGGQINVDRMAPVPVVKKKKRRKPNMKSRVYTATKEVNGEDLLPALLEEFPNLQLPMETWHELWRKSIVQLEYLTRSYRNSRRKKDPSQQQIDDAEKRQRILYSIIRKELSHAERMKEMKESKKQRIAVKNRLHEKRITSARARKYYNEFSAQMRSRMMSKKTKEEQIFKRLFQDSLHIQRERIHELQKYLQEVRRCRADQLQNEIDSMENFYHDQFQIVAENIKQQREQKIAQEAAQTQLINSMKQDLRKKMEEDVRSIQEQLCQDEDQAYFRELDAERVKRELQLANYVFKLRPRSYLWNSDYY